ERLRHFGSRRAMDIEHLGESTIDQLVEKKRVLNFADLYTLTADEVAGLERFAEKSAENLVAAIAGSKTRGPSGLLNALGIRLVGERAAAVLASRFGTVDHLMRASAETLAEVHGVGPHIAKSLTAFFADEHNRTVIGRLGEAGVVMSEAGHDEDR